MKIAIQWLQANNVLLINAGSLLGTTGITSALGFVYWWAAAREFSPEAVGLASATISAMTLLGTLAMIGLNTLLIGELPRQPDKTVSLICSALFVVGGVGVSLGVAYAVGAAYLSTSLQLLGTSLANAALFALGVGLTAMSLVLDQALIGLLRGELQLWRNTIFAGVKLVALLLAGLWLLERTGVTIYVTWIIGIIVSLAALAGFLIVKQGWPTGISLPRWAMFQKLGYAALMHHALNITLQAPSLILPILVLIVLSVKVNAWFYVSWNLTSVANTISVALATTLYAMSSAESDAVANKLQLTLRLAFIACVLTNCVLLLASRQVLGLFGAGYADQATWSLRILSLESFPFIIKSHFIALVRIHGRLGHTTLLMIASGLLELAASALGARLGGLNGLSLGWCTAMCIEAAFMSRTVYTALVTTSLHPAVSMPTEEG